jgi:hypothetical protein
MPRSYSLGSFNFCFFNNAGARLAGGAPEAPIDPDIRPIHAVIRENEAWHIWR